MAKFSTTAAVAATAVALLFVTPASAEAVAHQSAAKGASLVSGSVKTINFFSGSAKASKKRRAEVAALAATPVGGAAASVAQKTNFLQLGLVAAAAAGAGGAVGVAASGSNGTAASN